MATRDISTRLVLQGEKEYRAAMTGINRDLKTLDSQLKLVDSSFSGQRNTVAALEARHKALSEVIAQQTQKHNAEKTALESVQRLQAQYAQQAADAREKLDTLAKTTDDATKETDEYKEAVRKLEAEISKNETAEGKCATAVANHTQKANQAQIKINDLNRELQANDRYLDEAKSSADGCATSIDAFGKEVAKAADNAEELGEKGKGGIDALAGALAAAGVTATLKEIADALVACVDASLKFESAMAGVAKTTDMTDAELEGMAAAFTEMSLQIPMSAAGLAQIAEAGGQLGIAKDDLAEFTEIMAKLGTATDMSATEAATMLAQFSAVTGMSPELYSNLGSAVVALGNNFSTTEKKITEMAQVTAGAGANAGMSEPEILALSAAVTSLGIEAGTGGTNMSKLIGDMQMAVETGEGLTEWAAAAGMSATEFSTLWGVDAVGAIRAFITGLGDTDESMLATLSTLGVTEARTVRMITSLANAEKQNGTLTKAISLSNKAFSENNALNKEAATRYETTESRIQMYENSVDALRVAIGNQLTPALGGLADIGADVNKWAADFIEENRWLVPAVTGAVAALGALSAGVMAVTVVAPALSAAWTALSTALSASPWMLVASAVLGLVVAISAYADTTRETLGELTEAATALPEAFSEADQGYADNLAQIEGTAAKAEALIGRLVELEEKNQTTGLDDSEWREWNAILGALVETVPELSEQINLQTGEIEGGTQALIDNIAAWRQNAIEQAKIKAVQNKRDAWASAIAEMTENQVKLNIAQREADALNQSYSEAVDVLAERLGVSRDVLDAMAGSINNATIESYGGDAALQGYASELSEMYYEAQEAAKNVETLEAAVAAGEEAVTAADEEMDAYIEAIDAMSTTADGAAGSVDTLTAAEMAQVEQFEALQAQLTELTEAYQAYYDGALENISGVVGGFDEVTEAETKSIQESMDALDDQLNYLTNYSDNLLKLKELADENGIDLNANLVAKLSDGSTESAAILQGIVDDGGTKLADLNTKFGTVEEGKKSFATIVAEMQTDFTQKTDAILAQMTTVVDGLDQSDEAGTAASNIVTEYTGKLEDGVATVRAIVNRYLAEINRLNMTRVATLSTSHAAGLYTVPYDEYPAVLHKGERVLTALQAQAMDAQESVTYNYPIVPGGAASQALPTSQAAAIDYVRFGQAVAERLDGMVVTMDGERVGVLVAPYVSEAQGDDVNAGRFGG